MKGYPSKPPGQRLQLSLWRTCMNELPFMTLADACSQIATRKRDVNTNRPPSALGKFPPVAFTLKAKLEMPEASTRKLTQRLSTPAQERRGSGDLQ